CWWCSPPITSRAATTSWPFSSRAARPERSSDPALRQKLGVVALSGLRLLDLLGRIELGEIHDLDVVAGPLERVLVDERARRVDAQRAREPDVALRPLAIAGRAALGRLEGLAEAALTDRQDVLLGVHAVRDRRRLELVRPIRLAHVARPLRVERMNALRVVLLGERALPDLLGRVDVALDDVLRVRDRPGVLRPRAHELDRITLERARHPE